MEYIKISDNEIKVIKTETNESEQNYTYEYLLTQRANIIKQKETEDAKRNEEIAEVDTLLAECEKLGIAEKVESEEVIPK